MRVILDARQTNRLFRPAPPVSLVTAEGFANIAVDVTEVLRKAQLWRPSSLLLSLTCKTLVATSRSLRSTASTFATR